MQYTPRLKGVEEWSDPAEDSGESGILLRFYSVQRHYGPSGCESASAPTILYKLKQPIDMRALLAIAGFLFGGVSGSALLLKFGTWVEEKMTDEELCAFYRICERFELPVPQNPENPSTDWKKRVDQRISELPEEEQVEIRREIEDILQEPAA